ncbi:MAG: ABC transporter ATP-binding protein [Clostridia bacterium]
MGTNAIEITHLTKNYKDFSLNDISFTLPLGSILGLVGENGAGKSTTIKLITNTILKTSGTINVFGVNNETSEFNKIKEEIGVVFDEAYFPEVLTATAVNSIMKSTYKNWDEKKYFEFMKKFSLPLKLQFQKFSRGMKMKLAIAVSLSHNPKLLILDEATSGLDPMVRDEILTVFNEFTRDEKNAILLSSHIISDLEKICDYIAFIHKGRLLFCEEKDKLQEEYAIVKVTADDFLKIPTTAIRGKKESPYGVEVLVLKSNLPSFIKPEFTNLEDIILFLAKGEN